MGILSSSKPASTTSTTKQKNTKSGTSTEASNVSPRPRLGDFPEYNVVADELARLNARLQDAIARKRLATEQGYVRSTIQVQEDAVLQVANGADPAELAKSPELSHVAKALDYRREVSLLERAMPIVEQRLRNARSNVSKQVCKQMTPEWLDIIKQQVVAVEQLLSAVQAEEEILEHMARHSIAMYDPFPPELEGFRPHFVGGPGRSLFIEQTKEWLKTTREKLAELGTPASRTA